MHEREPKQFSTFQHRIHTFICFIEYRQMSFKEELRRIKYFYSNRIDIHVIYVKKFLTKWIFEDTQYTHE